MPKRLRDQPAGRKSSLTTTARPASDAGEFRTMKKIKLTGRELAVLRAIDFSTGTPGADLVEFTRLSPEDLVDVINSLLDVGYLECQPAQEHVSEEVIHTTIFEVNPSYALDLREAMVKRY